MLQDVQELRKNDWVPRIRQEKQLKTIEQVSPSLAGLGGRWDSSPSVTGVHKSTKLEISRKDP